MNRYRILEFSLLASIVLFLGMAVSQCKEKPADRAGVAPPPDRCNDVEWTGLAKGEITKAGMTTLPTFAPNHCARILFSGPSTGHVALESYVDADVRDPGQWDELARVESPDKTPQGWGGLVDNSELKLRIRSFGTIKGPIHYAVFQAKPKT